MSVHVLACLCSVSFQACPEWTPGYLKNCPKRFVSPDGNLRCFGESDCALQPCVYLSHFNGSFQTHQLHALITDVCVNGYNDLLSLFSITGNVIQCFYKHNVTLRIHSMIILHPLSDPNN